MSSSYLALQGLSIVELDEAAKRRRIPCLCVLGLDDVFERIRAVLEARQLSASNLHVLLELVDLGMDLNKCARQLLTSNLDSRNHGPHHPWP